MGFENYQIVKLITKDDKEVFAAIVKHYDDKRYRVRILKQPLYEIVSTRNCTTLFKQFCHEDDEVDYVLMEYVSGTMSIVVHENMMKKVSHNETVELLKYFNHTSFGDGIRNKSNENLKREKMIISEALDSLYINNKEESQDDN